MDSTAEVQAHRSTDPAAEQAPGPRRPAPPPGARRARARPLAAVVLTVALTLGLTAPARAALVSETEEIRIGRQAATELEAEVGLSADAASAGRLAAIGRRVAAASSRPTLPWTFKVLRARQVNAISLPGGFIYATEGLLRFVQSDAELAFVMAHEVGHVAARHHVHMIERQFAMSLLAQLLLGRDASAALIGDIVRFLLTRGFSRENEFDADRLGVGYAHRAGYDASAGLRFMERLRATEGRDPGQVDVLLRTHPALADRIRRLRDHLRELGYRVGARGVPGGRGRARACAAPGA